MPDMKKYDKILNALDELLGKKKLQTISVSEIAQAAGIGKGSIYYYFPSKDAIFEALIKRKYEAPIETAKDLAKETQISPFTRMAMIFAACRSSSATFLSQRNTSEQETLQESTWLHQKYLKHLIFELKPVLTAIIQQGIENEEIHFEYPSALAEIVLIILSVKLDNMLVPSTPEEIEETLQGLVSLLEKGTENPSGSLKFLTLTL